ncbi:hypothetical protein BC628DRAFT_1435495 [Trametes gibbosa]|nr:hypothetical protein BC628DRAFT_1435495 [Trametes gibbosa]
MPAVVHLPVELLSHIVSYLGDNRDTLRALCLSNHLLHAVSYPLLFAVRDFRGLGAPYLAPLLRYLCEIRISWKADMHGGRDAQVLSRFLAPYLSAEGTPRLQKLTIRGLSTDGMTYLNTLGDIFGTFGSLTSLHLNETYHRNMRDVQLFICALPHLTHLHVNAVTWTSPEFNTCDGEEDCDLFTRPALKHLRISPVYPSCMLPLIVWLARTPSARSLQTFDIPRQARVGPDALPQFGSSVRHVLVPLSGIQPGKTMQSYVSLSSLTLYVRVDDFLTRNYERLPDVIKALPSPAELRELEIHVPYEAVINFVGILGAFSRLDDLLFCPIDPTTTDSESRVEQGHSCTTPRFDSLFELRVVLLSVSTPDPKEREGTDWATQLRMPRAAALGRLSVRFGHDERCVCIRERSFFACRYRERPI